MKITIEFGDHRHEHHVDAEGAENLLQWISGDIEFDESSTTYQVAESLLRTCNSFLDKQAHRRALVID